MSYKISPSGIKLMKECERCFYDKYAITGGGRPKGIFVGIANGIDRVLRASVAAYEARGELPPELMEISPNLKPFPDKEVLAKWSDGWGGKPGLHWNAPNGHTLRGEIDAAFMLEDKVLILDYKTKGSPLKDDEVEKKAEFYKDQVDIYNFLVAKNGWEPADRTAFYFLWAEEAQGGLSNLQFGHRIVQVPSNPENAEELFENAVELLSGPRPEIKGNCSWCQFGRKRAGLNKNYFVLTGGDELIVATSPEDILYTGKNTEEVRDSILERVGANIIHKELSPTQWKNIAKKNGELSKNHFKKPKK